MIRRLAYFVILALVFVAMVGLYRTLTGAGTSDPSQVPAPSHTNELKTATQPAVEVP